MVTIIREIDGVPHEFVLTDDELFNAFQEQEHKFDVENVRNAVDDISDELASDLANNIRRQMNKYDVNFDFALGEAIAEFNGDLEEDRIEHANLQAILENGEYEGRVHKHRLEAEMLTLETYWGEYLTHPDKEL